MDAGTAAILAASLSSIIGGLIGFTSSYLSARQIQKHQSEALKHEFLRDRLSSILPLRQKALQSVWFFLVQSTLGNKPSPTQMDEYISITIWLPKSLRAHCIEALSRLGDEKFVASVQTEVINYIETLETFDKKSIE